MFNIAVQYGEHYQLAIVSGVATAAEFCAAHSFVTEWVARTRCTRLLVDLLGVTGTLDARDEQALREHLERTMPSYDRVAVVAQGASARGLIRKVAEARGVLAREFAELAAAEAWLQEA